MIDCGSSLGVYGFQEKEIKKTKVGFVRQKRQTKMPSFA
jgi:hypothetical protein